MEQIGRYRVVRPLGQGGMGQVFLARDPDLDRDVALKLLHGGAGNQRGDKRERFRAEARSIAALRHPGIVTVYEIGEHEGQQFIAMEYLPGRSMRELIEGGEQVLVLITICQRVTAAVAAAHQQGILHRDIKPENVVVCDDGTVKVVDFGLARKLDAPSLDPDPARSFEILQAHATAVCDAFTRTIDVDPTATQASNGATANTVFGTPAYMPPEVLMGESASPASDAYALGVMLYESIAGKRPVTAPTLHELIANIIDGEPPAELDHPLGRLVGRLLSRDVKARPPLDEADDELSAFVVRTPIAPVRPSVGLTSGRGPQGWRDAVGAAPTMVSPPLVVGRHRSRWTLIAVPLGVIAIGAVVFATTRGGTDAAPVAALVPRPRIQIAVQDLDVKLQSSWNSDKPLVEVSEVMSMLLGQIEGVRSIDLHRLRGVSSAIEMRKAAVRADAGYLVQGSIHDDPKRILHARVEVVDLATKAVTPVPVGDRPSRELGAMMVDLANGVVKAIDPHGQALVLNQVHADELYAAGRERYEAADWYAARPFLEEAVYLDPKSFDGWLTLALTHAWVASDPDEVSAAALQALANKQSLGAKAGIAQGVLDYVQNRYPDAIAVLGPLESDPALSQLERLDVDYYLGEAYWHDGQHAKGFDFLNKALTSKKDAFRPAAIHCAEYMVARRKLPEAGRFLSLLGNSRLEEVAFANREYKKLADDKTATFRYYAMIVLDRDTTAADELTGIDRPAWRAGRALGHGKSDDARREIDALWAAIGDQRPSGHASFLVEILGEMALSHDGLRSDLDRVLAYQQKWIAEDTRSRERFAILAAPLVGGTAPVPRQGASTRNARLADAIDAELRGDRKTAADILEQLIEDPTALWDYPERIALVRNLAALGRFDRIEVVCDDLAHPAIIRPAFEAARATCRAYKNRRSR